MFEALNKIISKVLDVTTYFISERKESIKVFVVPRPKYVTKITFTDKVFSYTLLPLFPKFIRPNHLTLFRFVSTPFVVMALVGGAYKTGLILFVISALSDALDGAMARTRSKITDWGIVFDPLADKLLISSVSVVTIAKVLNPYLASAIVVIEILLITFAYLRYRGEVVPAKLVGKLKMIFQCFGVGFLLLYMTIGTPILLPIAEYTIYGAILFALLSLFVYRSI